MKIRISLVALLGIALTPAIGVGIANATGNCPSVTGNFAQGGGQAFRNLNGNCNQIGTQARYSGNGVTIYTANPGYGANFAQSAFDTSKYYGTAGHLWKGSSWTYNAY